jgi:hypothetical protein
MYANLTPKMRGMKGVHLSDFFPGWQKAMSCMINEDVPAGATMVKHKPVGGGLYATRNFIIKAGTHIVHSHLHRQSVQSVSDYRDYDLYGVDTGCVADKEHRAFLYCEDSPQDWRSGFVALTYRDGKLLYPQLITKWDDNHVQFKGEIIKV